ncbi:MAG: hypothetical protein GEV28_28125 [Actinophytocola sp.]|uniref:hypothetical protein n=1 Tax=Actinophytocola sp. TaxID=1872138 RepID=UPI00132679FA|nr:hypothetical protein [Actinophytocola sp.]MPZ84052.1 hypothetical protein [Actinophytocola sp.]
MLQLYPYWAGLPLQSLTQTLRIYRPDGLLLELTVASWGSEHLEPDPNSPGRPRRVAVGRESLPITEAQLAELGVRLTT